MKHIKIVLKRDANYLPRLLTEVRPITQLQVLAENRNLCDVNTDGC